jgi:hypothetical protein
VKHRVTRAIAIALALSSTGCGLTFDSTHLGVTATMAEPAQAPASGAAFRITKHPVYLLMGLFPVSEPNLEDVLAGQVGAGTAIASLRIHVRSRWSDLLVTALTLGIVTPRSVTFEGVVVGR